MPSEQEPVTKTQQVSWTLPDGGACMGGCYTPAEPTGDSGCGAGARGEVWGHYGAMRNGCYRVKGHWDPVCDL